MFWGRAAWSLRSCFAAALCAGVIGVVPARAKEPPPCQCEEHAFLASTTRSLSGLSGTLCQASHASSTVQILVHGATFDRRYWHTAPSGSRRSYVAEQLRGGYATFSYDQLGSGRSEHPASSEVTIDAHVQNLHEIIQALRAGTLGGVPFQRVVVVGHSLGSVVATLETGTHRDTDGLILSAFTHFGAPSAIDAFLSILQPAGAEPAFSDLDAGFFTTQPGTRAGLFFSADVAEPLLALDELQKGTVAIGELVPSPLGDASSLVTVPVMIAAGTLDPFSCSGDACASGAELAAREAGVFVASPSVQAIVLGHTGHALNFHRRAPRWFRAASAWVGQLDATAR